MGSEILDSSVVSRGEGWLSAWVGDEHVMMSAETGTCVSLSQTGGRIWEMLEHPLPVGELCRDLAAEYDAEPAVLHDHVIAFLEGLREERAIRIE